MPDRVSSQSSSISAVSAPAKPKLLDQLRNEIRVRHYSIRTEKTYIEWVKDFIFFHGTRHPGEMGQSETHTGQATTRPSRFGNGVRLLRRVVAMWVLVLLGRNGG